MILHSGNVRTPLWLPLIMLVVLGREQSEVHAQELLGAKQVIERIREEADKNRKGDAARDGSLKARLEELSRNAALLVPAAAATKWIELFDAWVESRGDTEDQNQPEFQDLVNVLPHPRSWGELSKQLDQRPLEGSDRERVRCLTLRLFGHRLLGQKNAELADTDELRKLLPVQKPQPNAAGVPAVNDANNDETWKREARQQVQKLRSVIRPELAVEDFREQLEDNAALNRYRSISVPNLVRLVGNAKAAELLETALVQKRLAVQFSQSGSETVSLARDVARRRIADITYPQWDLVESLDTPDLYEAFRKLKADTDRSYSFNHRDANAWYLASLIAKERFDEALKFLEKLRGDPEGSWSSLNSIQVLFGYNLRDELEQRGHVDQLKEFLNLALNAHPELPLWDEYIRLASKQRKPGEVIDLLDGLLKRDGLRPQQRERLHTARADALLAVNRVEEGVEAYLKYLETAKGVTRSGGSTIHSFDAMNAAIKVARVGRLTGNAQWVAKGLDKAQAEIALEKPTSATQFEDLLDLLRELKEYALSERLILEALLRHAAESNGESSPRTEGDVQTFSRLMRVYHDTGRHEDVVMLLEQVSDWEYRDIADWLNESNSRNDHDDSITLPFLAAQSLAAVGRTVEARRIVEAVNQTSPGFDAGWALMLDLAGDDFPKHALQVFDRDPFEERPLIWLAKWHLDRGQLDLAEQRARQAIAIDPSDGEQGRGDRMRVYAVLADILRKRGDEPSAKVYDGAVLAIREAETADQFYQAGLLSRGIQLYKASLNHFADAYCVQSRLAVKLVQQGDEPAAAQHYQRAFELMPSSFGRVESHCFGCEGVFKGEQAANIAEQVFRKLIEAQPDNPRVQYLMGYLLKSKHHTAEAAEYFRKAVRLDPDYLSAWKSLHELASSDEAKVESAERDRTYFQIRRLDPDSRHSHTRATEVEDLAGLWAMQNERRAPLKFDKLLPLAASAKRLDERRADDRGADGFFGQIPDGRGNRDSSEFATHPVFESLGRLLRICAAE